MAIYHDIDTGEYLQKTNPLSRPFTRQGAYALCAIGAAGSHVGETAARNPFLLSITVERGRWGLILNRFRPRW
jgi:hypothetical protein